MINVHVYDADSMMWATHMFDHLNYKSPWKEIDKALALLVDGVTEDNYSKKGSGWKLLKEVSNSLSRTAHYVSDTGDVSYITIINTEAKNA
jgi:hypothetical protein